MAADRIQILARQLTAATLEQEARLTSGKPNVAFCPKAMKSFLVHDNEALREAIFEFMKVRAGVAGKELSL